MIEQYLYNHGFRASGVREITRNQLYVTGAFVILSLLLLPFTFLPLHAAFGAVIITFNFIALAKFAQHIVSFQYDRRLLFKMLFRFYGRLLLTGIVLFILLAWMKVSVVALLIGLSTVPAVIVVWGGTRIVEQKV